jgi:uncharacterized protein YjbI with pentapeptide repeats
LVSWSPPATDGGSPITGYVASATNPRWGTDSCTTTGATSCTIGEVFNGAPYLVHVWAVNSVGQGAPAKAYNVVPTSAQNCAYVGPYANLQNCNFAFANLSNANLSNANLTGTNLFGANLGGANLTGISFAGTMLAGANLTNSNLSFDSLAGANLSSANFTGANLNGVSSGNIVGTPSSLPANWTVAGGYLIGPGANLNSANFTGANLTGVNFTNLSLPGAVLTNANLASANFAGANLTGCALAGSSASRARCRPTGPCRAATSSAQAPT